MTNCEKMTNLLKSLPCDSAFHYDYQYSADLKNLSEITKEECPG